MKNMKIKKNLCEEIIFLDIPLFLLGINYVLYNALSMESIKNYLRLGAITLLFIGWLLKGNYKVAKNTFLAM